MSKQEIAVVGDSALCTGFRLAGIQKVFLAEGRDAERKLEELMGSDEAGMIIVNEKALDRMSYRIKKLIERKAKPVVIAVPDKSGAGSESEGLKAMVRRAIGIELM